MADHTELEHQALAVFRYSLPVCGFGTMGARADIIAVVAVCPLVNSTQTGAGRSLLMKSKLWLTMTALTFFRAEQQLR